MIRAMPFAQPEHHSCWQNAFLLGTWQQRPVRSGTWGRTLSQIPNPISFHRHPRKSDTFSSVHDHLLKKETSAQRSLPASRLPSLSIRTPQIWKFLWVHFHFPCQIFRIISVCTPRRQSPSNFGSSNVYELCSDKEYHQWVDSIRHDVRCSCYLTARQKNQRPADITFHSVEVTSNLEQLVRWWSWRDRVWIPLTTSIAFHVCSLLVLRPFCLGKCRHEDSRNSHIHHRGISFDVDTGQVLPVTHERKKLGLIILNSACVVPQISRECCDAVGDDEVEQKREIHCLPCLFFRNVLFLVWTESNFEKYTFSSNWGLNISVLHLMTPVSERQEDAKSFNCPGKDTSRERSGTWKFLLLVARIRLSCQNRTRKMYLCDNFPTPDSRLWASAINRGSFELTTGRWGLHIQFSGSESSSARPSHKNTILWRRPPIVFVSTKQYVRVKGWVRCFHPPGVGVSLLVNTVITERNSGSLMIIDSVPKQVVANPTVINVPIVRTWGETLISNATYVEQIFVPRPTS